MRSFIVVCAFTLVASCYPRLERDVDFTIQGISFNSGGFEIDQDMLRFSLDRVEERIEYQYELKINPKRLATEADLYVMFDDADEVNTTCSDVDGNNDDKFVLGCYFAYMVETYIGARIPEEGNDVQAFRECYYRNTVFAHEMLHFFSFHVLWEKRNEIFGDNTWREEDKDHITPGLWNREASSVETHVMAEIDAECRAKHLDPWEDYSGQN